ncbi:MAG: DUF3788 domain-containing protein [Candidatus Marinimicrobia bacterium]|nr:DUF3788 domain-containing protein [Candidatus Neomarinimicrobiota bacterium]
MSDLIFNQKDQPPEESSLKNTLGKSYPALKNVILHITEQFGVITEEWKFYGKNYGWQLKLLLKKRNLCFIIPEKDCFKIVFIFGDKAVSEVEKSDIPDVLKNELLSAKKYLEGRGLSFMVSERSHIQDIQTLIRIKVNN